MAAFARSLRAAAPLAKGLVPRAAPMMARSSVRTISTTRALFEKRYTKDHEWIDISADKKTGTIGISTYAAEQLGDVVYVEIPEITGDFVEGGDTVGAVESVKSASDINAPVRLKVTQVNEALEEKPSTINRVPEDDSAGGGWIAKVEVDEASVAEFDSLMDAEAYQQFVGSEDH